MPSRRQGTAEPFSCRHTVMLEQPQVAYDNRAQETDQQEFGESNSDFHRDTESQTPSIYQFGVPVQLWRRCYPPLLKPTIPLLLRGVLPADRGLCFLLRTL